jgi:hypothetical protein
MSEMQIFALSIKAPQRTSVRPNIPLRNNLLSTSETLHRCQSNLAHSGNAATGGARFRGVSNTAFLSKIRVIS